MEIFILKKKIGNHSLIILLLLFISCSKGLQEDYLKYQTFDEYSLTGIEKNKTSEPFVYIKELNDTIFVISSDQKYFPPLKYINKGKYWFNLSVEQFKYNKNYNRDTIPFIKEKYIYNDTIMELTYYYDRKREKRLVSSLYFETRKDKYYFSLPEKHLINRDSVFEQLKFILLDKRRDNIHYEKKIKNDTLYIYEKKMDNTIILHNKKIMNSLGEFEFLRSTYNLSKERYNVFDNL